MQIWSILDGKYWFLNCEKLILSITNLYHFMRCSQLEYGHGVEGQPPIQVRVLIWDVYMALGSRSYFYLDESPILNRWCGCLCLVHNISWSVEQFLVWFRIPTSTVGWGKFLGEKWWFQWFCLRWSLQVYGSLCPCSCGSFHLTMCEWWTFSSHNEPVMGVISSI